MQLLLNESCELPALLERSLKISRSLSPPDLDTVDRLWRHFYTLLTRLREWERRFKAQASHPLMWSRSDPETWSSPGASAIWFPNLMTATSLTHCWAFEIVVKSHLEKLHQMASTARVYHLQTRTEACIKEEERISVLTLADMICDSTSYLLQSEFKYHGLWSAFFTLPTALRVFSQEKELSASRAGRSLLIAKLLASREVYFPCN